MRVVVDPQRCEAHEKCVAIAPEVFELGEDGYSHARLEDVPEELHPKVDRAIRLCPRQAIGVTGEAGQ
jgi:ferredoxin